MTIYVRGENPIWFFNNLIGQAVDDTYYAFFLTNTLPYIPQAVYQDPNGISPWSNPLEFQSSGGLPNNLYFNPTLTYRIEIRQGPDQTYPLIWLIENYTLAGYEEPGTDSLLTASNMITNPQFSDIYFSSPFTYTQGSSGTYTIPIGPGWNLVLTGTGTTVLTQGTLAGDANIQGNPPYYLTINNSGWTTAQLVQTFKNNGALFANGAVSIAFAAVSTTSAQNITVSYIPSGPSNTTVIFPSTSILTGDFAVYSNVQSIPASVDTTLDGSAYVNIAFTIAASGIISFTNIQLTGQSTALVDPELEAPLFEEITYERTVDQEFHAYRGSILLQPKDSLLAGWNFGFNPWQFTTTTVTNVATNQYTADQTLVIQQNYVANSTGNNVAVGQGSLANNYGLQIKAVGAHNQFGILQYIDPTSIRPYWNSILSSLVTASLTTTHSTTCKIKMRLIYIASLPSTTSATYPVATWTEFGDPVFASGITAIVPINDPVYTLSSTQQSFAFNGFVLPTSTNAAMTLGIFLYTVTDMNQSSTADYMIVNDVSLVPNIFAIASNPMTFDETLRRCQYYYEKSFDISIVPATSAAMTYNNAKTIKMYLYNSSNSSSNSDNGYLCSFGFDFSQTKRVTPTMLFYSPDSTNAGLLNFAINQNNTNPMPGSGTNPTDIAISNYSPTVDLDRVTMNCTATSTLQMQITSAPKAAGDEAVLYFHYTANAVLGNPTLP